jgi:hypothetical protein
LGFHEVLDDRILQRMPAIAQNELSSDRDIADRADAMGREALRVDRS